MSDKPMATVRVTQLPGRPHADVRIEVSCPSTSTGMLSITGPRHRLTRRQAITEAALGHERACGRCDLARVRRQGDPTHVPGGPEVEAAAERVARELQRAAALRYVDERRN